ncbi:hypothetical protein [Streptomyces luteireticuli]|uniref:hypothetical protein n=1 Tax=Streptomyces luteireticuli TaxID=173858 RepID=UPI0035581D12
MTTPPSPVPPAPTRTPVFVSHVAPSQRDVAYDHRAAQAAVPVTVHFRDETSTETLLVLGPDQLSCLLRQLGQAAEQRRALLAEAGGR